MYWKCIILIYGMRRFCRGKERRRERKFVMLANGVRGGGKRMKDNGMRKRAAGCLEGLLLIRESKEGCRRLFRRCVVN